MIDGEPTTIIKKRKNRCRSNKKSWFNSTRHSFKLRTQGVYSIQKVKRAVLEQNGQLIIIQTR